MNFFELFNEAITESDIQQVAKSNSEKPEKIKKAIALLGAAVVGVLIKRTTSEASMNLIHKHVSGAGANVPSTNDIFGNNASAVEYGNKMINLLAPATKGPIVNMVVTQTGVRNSLANSLCSVVMSVAMRILHKSTNEKQFDAPALANHLLDQREGMINNLPDGLQDTFVELMGLRNFMGDVAVAQPTEADIPPVRSDKVPDRSSSSIDFGAVFKWVAILAVMGGIGWGAYYFLSNWKAAPESVEEMPETKTIEEPVVKDSATKTTTTAIVPAAIPSGPFEAYLADSTARVGKTLKWEGADFEDNTTTPKAETQALVKQIGDLLKNHPTAEIKIIAYANDAKLPMSNKMLSVKRSFAIKQMLIDQGINFVRVDAEGKGSGVNPRDTTGRPQTSMRQLFVKFIKK